MLSLFNTIQKKNNQQISILSNAKSERIVQSAIAGKLHQSDLNKSLKQADKYGHKLSKKHLPNVVDTTVAQSKMGLNNSTQSDNISSSQAIQAAWDKKLPWKKNRNIERPTSNSSIPTQLPEIPLMDLPPIDIMGELAHDNPNLFPPIPQTTAATTPAATTPAATTPAATTPAATTPAATTPAATTPAATTPSKDFPKKDVGKITKTADLGSNIFSTASAATKAASEATGGTGGVLKLGAVAMDGYDAYTAIKEGNKAKAGTSGLKFVGGGAKSGANLAKFGGDAVNSMGVGLGSGIGGTISGSVDIWKGGNNVHQSRKGYHNIKDVARNAAERIEPSQPNSKPRTTKELAQVQEIGANRETIPDDLQKQLDILSVAQYAAKTQSKTTKREGINTAAGVVQTTGGILTITGAAGAGIGAVPGAATSMAGASIKPAAWGTRNIKQWARDKKFPGSNQQKTSERKDHERAGIAGKLAEQREDPQMQTIFQNLPRVNTAQMDSFTNPDPTNQMSQSEISKILKRRHY